MRPTTGTAISHSLSVCLNGHFPQGPPQSLASFIQRSPGHQVDLGSAALMFVGRSATKWLRTKQK
jgi:hypothetical protein